MNREILFRGKRIDDGEWIEGDLTMESGLCRAFIIMGWDYDKNNLPGTLYIAEVIPETASQFTELIDKNGNKIFENDVVRFEDYCCVEKVTTIAMGVVNFSGAEFCVEQISGINTGWMNSFYGPDGKEFSWGELEIIGNIWDNPELVAKHD